MNIPRLFPHVKQNLIKYVCYQSFAHRHNYSLCFSLSLLTYQVLCTEESRERGTGNVELGSGRGECSNADL